MCNGSHYREQHWKKRVEKKKKINVSSCLKPRYIPHCFCYWRVFCKALKDWIQRRKGERKDGLYLFDLVILRFHAVLLWWKYVKNGRKRLSLTPLAARLVSKSQTLFVSHSFSWLHFMECCWCCTQVKSTEVLIQFLLMFSDTCSTREDTKNSN